MATTTGQVFKSSESVGLISKTGVNTAELSASVITVGGLQYTTDAVKVLDTTISGLGGLDTGVVAAFKTYNIFAVVSGSDISLVASLSSAPSGFAAYSNIGKLSTITAGALNGASGKEIGSVGDSKYSMLSEEDFITENGGGWILSDGRSVIGSAFETLTGDTTVPDGRGQFLRSKNNGRTDGQENPDGDVAIGTQTGDAIREIEGDFWPRAREGTLTGDSTEQTNGAFGRTPNSRIYARANGGNFNQSVPGVDFKASRVVPTGADNRPKNITMNLFIKIN
jgi:hypothetical protein